MFGSKTLPFLHSQGPRHILRVASLLWCHIFSFVYQMLHLSCLNLSPFILEAQLFLRQWFFGMLSLSIAILLSVTHKHIYFVLFCTTKYIRGRKRVQIDPTKWTWQFKTDLPQVGKFENGSFHKMQLEWRYQDIYIIKQDMERGSFADCLEFFTPDFLITEVWLLSYLL